MWADTLRTGSWVTPSRLRIYPYIFLISLLGVSLAILLLSKGMLDPGGRPLGTDFLSFWSASYLIWEGRPASAYDHDALFAVEQAVAGDGNHIYTWLYPPMALLVVAPLAAFSYPSALILWLGLTLAGYLSALRKLMPDPRGLIPSMAFAPVFINIGHGQNGFLTASLMGWGLILMPRRPWLGGALLGTLIYKPQLGLLIPLAIIADRNWRALLGAALSVLALTALSYGCFGHETWQGFLAKTPYSLQLLESGLVPWQKMISPFAAMRMLGGPVTMAWVIQIGVGMFAARAVWRVWYGAATLDLKIASLAFASLLTAPLALDYDALVMGLGLAALVADGLKGGFRYWEITALALAWLLPLLWRPLAFVTAIPLGTLTLFALLWLTLRRLPRQ